MIMSPLMQTTEANFRANITEVVIGLIYNKADDLLIAQRTAQQSFAGFWEFPGGKIEPNESPQMALIRELKEELNIEVSDPQPCFTFLYPQTQPGKSLRFYVFKVKHFQGQPIGNEGQPIQYVPFAKLNHYRFPEANRIITNTLTLPTEYGITPDLATLGDQDAFIQQVCDSQARHQLKLLQLRTPSLAEHDYIQLAKTLRSCLQDKSCELVLNCSVETAMRLNSPAIHLSKRSQASLLSHLTNERLDYLQATFVSFAAHNEQDLLFQQSVPVNCTLLSPVKTTQTHPEAPPLGWQTFQDITQYSQTPVYALGGLIKADLSKAQAMGGYGIAGIGLAL